MTKEYTPRYFYKMCERPQALTAHLSESDFYTTMYLEDPKACIAEELLGDDVMSDIIEKFRVPFRLVADELAERLNKTLRVIVQPSLNDRTIVMIVSVEDDPIVYVTHERKSWNFWFETVREFDEFIQKMIDRGMKHAINR
jgi:hypothetical protein